jgi:hypothetical protein
MPLTSGLRLSARSAADAFLLLLLQALSLRRRLLIAQLAAPPKALDDTRYCPSVRQASVLLETWMVTARHNLLDIELSAGRGYHV